MSEFAEYEREKIRERTRRGMLRSVEAGNVTTGGSNGPYGYDLATVDGRRVLTVNDEQAAVIRLIFDLYVKQGKSIHGIATYLTERQIPKPAKEGDHRARNLEAQWSRGTIQNILVNECYIGRWHYRKTRQAKSTQGDTRQLARPRDEWIEVKVPAIVDEAIFQAAQGQRELNKRRMGKQHKRFYLLGGMLKCGHCDSFVTGSTRNTRGQGISYYECGVYRTPKRWTGRTCDNAHYYRVETVDKVVWEWVKRLYTSPNTLDEALTSYQARQAEAQRPQLELIEATTARLAAAEGEKARLVKAYASGVLTLDEIATTKNELDRRLNDLTLVLTELRAEIPATVLSKDEIDQIRRDAAELRAGVLLADDDPPLQRRILEQLLFEGRLVYVDGKKHIDVSCILGEERLPTSFTATNHCERRCTLRARLPLDNNDAATVPGTFFASVTMVNA